MVHSAEREYQQYEERNGKVENHQMAKDLLVRSLYPAAPPPVIDSFGGSPQAGFAGAEADKLFETHGLVSRPIQIFCF